MSSRVREAPLLTYMWIVIERKIYAKEKFLTTEDFSNLDTRKREEEELKERKKLRREKRKQNRLRQLGEEGKSSDEEDVS